MVGVISWLKGYVRIRVSGLSVERFMNLCGRKNILLWDVTGADGLWEMNISIKAFRFLRPIVRKTGTKVVITERCGLPFFIAGLNKKKVFLLGCMLSVAFWYLSAGFVWKIEIDGNYKITEEQLKDYLSSQNVSVGTLKKNIDIEKLEKGIRIEFPDITWTSGKFEGTSFLLSVKENDGIKVEETQEEEVGYDLVAHTDGEIYSIIVRKGIPLVKQSDMVTQGMILVHGRIPVNNDDGTIKKYLYEKADADIFIKYDLPYTDSVKKVYIKKVYTGRTGDNIYVRFGEKEIGYKGQVSFMSYDTVVQETTPSIFKDLKIPMLWGKYTYREYQNTECLYTNEEASEILNENFLQFLVTLEEKGVQIIEKDVKIIDRENEYELSGVITVADPVKAYAYTEHLNSDITTEIE